MSWSFLAWVADALVVLALVVMTVGVVGLRRMPDIYTQLHATSKAVFLGVIAIIVASTASREPAIVSRGVLIAVFLLLTSPVSAHVIARAAYLRRERMRTAGAIDESGRGLVRAGAAREDDAMDAAAGPTAERPAIVVGYDGSEQAERALERVARLAGEDGVVTLVTAGSILPASSKTAAGVETGDAEERRRVAEHGRSRLAQLGIEAHIVETLADPAEALIDTARELDANLIVVGTRGRTGAARALLGSVSTSVVNRAHCDVLVVR